MTPKTALAFLIADVGSQTLLAEKLGVTQGHVSNWLHRDERISARFAAKAALIGKQYGSLITAKDLRPDVFLEASA